MVNLSKEGWEEKGNRDRGGGRGLRERIRQEERMVVNKNIKEKLKNKRERVSHFTSKYCNACVLDQTSLQFYSVSHHG